MELAAELCAPARGAETGRVRGSVPVFRGARASLAARVRPAEACGCTPTLLGATFLGECVRRGTWGCFSLRCRSGAAPFPLPYPTPSPPGTRTNPWDALGRPPAPTLGKPQSGSEDLFPFRPCACCHRPRVLLFGADHVQVSEEVGGGEPGEESARSGHE